MNHQETLPRLGGTVPEWATTRVMGAGTCAWRTMRDEPPRNPPPLAGEGARNGREGVARDPRGATTRVGVAGTGRPDLGKPSSGPVRPPCPRAADIVFRALTRVVLVDRGVRFAARRRRNGRERERERERP